LLVDSGSCCSILAPKDCQNFSSSLSTIQLTTASGSPINVLGEKSATISLQGLRRTFQWNFVVANVTQSILGADFLSASGLLVDCRNRRLVDQATSLTSNLSSSSIVSPVISVSSRTDTNHPALRRLLEKHCQIFGPLSIGEVKHSTQHFIETEGRPVFARSRQLHPDKQRIAEQEFQNMIDAGVIRPSRSSWSSPLHLVPKKTPGEWRPCGDYRELNKRTKFDRYPIPHIQSFNSNLAGCSIFSKLDLCRAFNQIPMNTADIEKTAVITPFGLFEWLKMPFGLRNAAQTMQRFLDEIFRGCPFVSNISTTFLLRRRVRRNILSTFPRCLLFWRMLAFAVPWTSVNFCEGTLLFWVFLSLPPVSNRLLTGAFLFGKWRALQITLHYGAVSAL
jgi:hypothetical protein